MNDEQSKSQRWIRFSRRGFTIPLVVVLLVATVLLRIGVSLYATVIVSLAWYLLLWWVRDPLKGTWRLRLRWFQFNLKALFVLTLLVGTTFAWVAIKVDRKKAERKAVAELKAIRAVVLYDWQWPGFRPEPTGPEWLRKLLGNDWFTSVSIVNFKEIREGSDEQLSPMAALPTVRHLYFPQMGITDAGLVHLKGLRSLEELGIGWGITDSGLVHLEPLARLRELHLSGWDITDKGLVHLAAMTRLEKLSLSSVRVSGDGLMHLARLPKLRELRIWVHESTVTKAAVAELKRALPQCEIRVTTPTWSE